MTRKRNARGFVTPTYADLFLRLMAACKWADGPTAARLGINWHRWQARQPHSRWLTPEADAVCTSEPKESPVNFDALLEDESCPVV